jgi:hypothetical protein
LVVQFGWPTILANRIFAHPAPDGKGENADFRKKMKRATSPSRHPLIEGGKQRFATPATGGKSAQPIWRNRFRQTTKDAHQGRLVPVYPEALHLF